jgi:hypothetical protein
MKTSLKTLIAAVGLLSAASMSAHAQAYKPDWATKLILPKNGTTPGSANITIMAGNTSTGYTLTLPTAAPGGAGYLLSGTTDGALSWVDPAASVTLTGDVTGAANNNSVVKLRGVSLNSDMATPSDANFMIYNSTGTSWHAVGLSGDISIDHSGVTAIGTGKVTSAMIADGTIANGDIASNAAIAYSKLNLTGSIVNNDVASNAAIAYSKLNLATSIVDGDIASNAAIAGSKINPTFGAQAVTSSTSIATTGTGTITSAGLLTASNGFTVTSGTVTLPNTSIANSALQGSGALTVTAGSGLSGGGSVALGGSTTISANINHNSSLTGNGGSSNLGLDLTNANTWTGTQTLGGVALTAASPSAYGANQNDLNLSASNSYFRLQASTNINITGIQNGVDGRVIVLTNVGSSNNITLTNEDAGSTTAGDRFHLAGSEDVILAPDGVATMVYDGSVNRWRLVSAQ